MDKRIQNSVESVDFEESSSTKSTPSRSNLSERSSATLDKRNKKRKKSRSDQIHHGSSNIWKNLSHIFTKSSLSSNEESPSVSLVNEKNKGSTFRRFSSIFKHQKSSHDALTDLRNIGVSPIGYQAAVSQTNFKHSEEKEIAMAVRLPSGSTTENVALTVELEALKKDEDSSSEDNSNEEMVMKCLEETESKTVFTGTLKVPPNTDFSKLVNMPLYIIDSNEELVFQPGAEISYRKVIRPSQEMLNDDDDCLTNMGTIKIKIKLDKLSELKKGIQLSISSINAEKDLISRSPIQSKTIHGDEKSQSIETIVEIENKRSTPEDISDKDIPKEITTAEVMNVNESANYMEESIKRVADLGSVSQISTAFEKCNKKSLNELEKYALANAIVNETLDAATSKKQSRISKLSVKQASSETTENYNNLENKGKSSSGYSQNQNRENATSLLGDRVCCLPENPTECLNTKCPTTKTIRDNYTQYSHSYFTTDKEVDIQCSLLLSNYKVHKNNSYSTPATSSSQTLLYHPGKHGSVSNKFRQASTSYESSETIIPNSTTSTATTNHSSTMLSDFSTYYDNDLKVPLNTPISSVNIQDNYKYIPDLSVSNQRINKAPEVYENNDQNAKNIEDTFEDVPSSNIIQSATVQESFSKFINLTSAEEELCLMDFNDSSKEKLTCEENLDLDSKPVLDKEVTEDKTLTLLQAVRLKLQQYLNKTSNKTDNVKTNPLNWCGLFSNSTNDNHQQFTNVRNISVSCDNPFSTYEHRNVEINKRCYEDDDEYYESRRNDVRGYFQNDSLNLLMESDDIKKNFNFYLSGDNFITNGEVGNISYQTYPLSIGTQPEIPFLNSLDQVKFKKTYYDILQNQETSSNNCDLGLNRRSSSKLESELEILQRMYDTVRFHMQFLIHFEDSLIGPEEPDAPNTVKTQTIEHITEDLTSSLQELKYCLSTITQILTKSTNSLQNIGTNSPSSFELLPYCPEEEVNLSNRNLTKENKSSNALNNNDFTLPTKSQPFPTAFKNCPSEDNMTKPSNRSRNINTSTTSENFAAISELLENQSSILKNIDTIMPTLLEPLSTISDLLGGQLHQINEDNQLQSNNIFPSSSTPHYNHALKENVCIPRSKSKTIYTVLPTTLEPVSMFFDLLRHHSPLEIQTKQTEKSDSSTPTELIPQISALFDSHSVKANKIKQMQASTPENINDILPNSLELFPPISDSSKSGKNEPLKLSNHRNHFSSITPTTSELFPNCNMFWDFSPKESQTKTTKNVASEPLPAVPNLIIDSPSNKTPAIVKNSSSERSETYFAMESEIERTIKELLKESEDIKEAVILSGGKEDAEPPFLVEYIKNLINDDPFLICKKIIDDIVNAVTGVEEINKRKKDQGHGPTEDVKHILNTLLDGIGKTDNFLDNPFPETISKFKKSLDAVSFLYDTSFKEPEEICTNLQIGDANNQSNSSRHNLQNECVTCFCSTTAFVPKIPKTSFTFGESPIKCLKTRHTGCKTPVRRRDGTTTISQEKKDLETSRLFNEILNLQSDMNQYERNSNEKLEESLFEEEFRSALDIIGEFQEAATVAQIPEYSQLQEMTSYKPAYALEMTPVTNSTLSSSMETENGDNTEDSNSKENSPTPSETEDKSISQSISNEGSNHTISKSQKFVQLTNSKNKGIPENQPSTSKKPLVSYPGTTEEEEIIQNVDLTQRQPASSTEPEYFIPEKASGITQKSFHNQALSNCLSRTYDTSSEGEVTSKHSVRKPRSKKKKTKEIVDIKPNTSIISDSDSEHFAKATQPTINSDQGLMSLNSHIVLKPAEAVVNLQEKMEKDPAQIHQCNPCLKMNVGKKETPKREGSTSEPSSKNGEDASDSEYEGDHETLQIKIPNPRHRYKSIQELNTPEEIALIERNLLENDILQRSNRIVLVDSDTLPQLEYEEFPTESESQSVSEYSVNSKQENSEEIKDIHFDNTEEAPTPLS